MFSFLFGNFSHLTLGVHRSFVVHLSGSSLAFSGGRAKREAPSEEIHPGVERVVPPETKANVERKVAELGTGDQEAA